MTDLTLEALMAAIKPMMDVIELRRKLQSGNYWGMCHPAGAEASGYEIQTNDAGAKFIKVFETEVFLTEHCPADSWFILLKFDWDKAFANSLERLTPEPDLTWRINHRFGWR